MAKEKRKKSAELAQLSCLLAFAMIVSYIEFLFPIPIGIPGAKLGLVNMVIVFCLYRYGAGSAVLINVSRIILCGLLFGSLYSVLYSLAGAAFSLFVMILLKRTDVFGMTGISIWGGIAHNMGQLLVAFLITGVPVLVYYIPVLLVTGVLTGFLNGVMAQLVSSKILKPL